MYLGTRQRKGGHCGIFYRNILGGLCGWECWIRFDEF